MSHEQQGKRKPQTGAAREAASPDQRASRRRNRNSNEQANWKTANPERVAAAVVAVTQHGFAIRFGYTRDQGAFAVGVVGDGEPYTDFTRPGEDIDLYLDALATDYSPPQGE